jgi:hypothetical protein
VKNQTTPTGAISPQLEILIRSQVAALVQRIGLEPARRQLHNLARVSVQSVAYGLPVRVGTLVTAGHALGLLAPPAAPMALSSLPSFGEGVGR